MPKKIDFDADFLEENLDDFLEDDDFDFEKSIETEVVDDEEELLTDLDHELETSEQEIEEVDSDLLFLQAQAEIDVFLNDPEESVENLFPYY